jgi:mannose-6-phosphate isomerase
MHLSPGQAAFLPPGRLHAYLSGLGLEIMANSDNVLRAGLTSKHIDVQELLKTMDFDRPEQGALEPVPGGGGWFAYPSFTEEFVLSGFELGPGCPRFEASLTGISILLCVQGELEISDQQSGEGIRLVQGQSVCIPGCVQSWTASGRGRAYVAETGVNLGSSFPDR